MPTDRDIWRDPRELAFRRYDAVLKYMVYENTVYWARSTFFLAANAGMFGFILSKLPYGPQDIQGAQGIVTLAGCTAGLVLSVLWRRALAEGEYWIKRWEDICISLEPEAMGEIKIWRDCRKTGKDGAKRVAHETAALFKALWSLSFAYVAALIYLKGVSWALSTLPLGLAPVSGGFIPRM